MKSFSSKLRVSITFFLLIGIFVLFAINLPYILPSTFSRFESNIRKEIEKNITSEISIENIKIFPLGEILLDNVKLYKDKKEYLIIPKCFIRFNLFSLIKDKAILLRSITLKRPLFAYNSKKIPFIIPKSLKGYFYSVDFSKNFFIQIDSGSFILNETNLLQGISFDSRLNFIDKETVSSYGSINLKKSAVKNYILNNLFFFDFLNTIEYIFKASLTEDDMVLDKFLVDFKQFKIDISGSVKEYKKNPNLDFRLKFKGLHFLEKVSLNSRVFVTGLGNLFVHIKGLFASPNLSMNMDKLRGKFKFIPKILKIDNFYCNMKIDKEAFKIEDSSCFINNFPIGFRCSLSDKKSPNIDFKIISYPGQLPSLKHFNPLNFICSFKGNRQGNFIKGELDGAIEKLNEKISFTSEDVSLKLVNKNIIPSTKDKETALSVNLENILFNMNINEFLKEIPIKDTSLYIYLSENKMHFIDFRSTLYKSLVSGEGFMDFNVLPKHIFCNFSLKDLDLSLLDMGINLKGKLTAAGFYNSKFSSYLKGKMSVTSGYIKDLAVLNLVSDFLGVRSLKELYLKEFSADFLFSKKGHTISFNDIILKADNIEIFSNIILADKNKVGGNISLRLYQEALKESFKLSLLVNKNIPYIDFDFELGGYGGNPHIKWLDANFKKKIKRFLSERGQRALEKRIEKSIDLLLKE